MDDFNIHGKPVLHVYWPRQEGVLTVARPVLRSSTGDAKQTQKRSDMTFLQCLSAENLANVLWMWLHPDAAFNKRISKATSLEIWSNQHVSCSSTAMCASLCLCLYTYIDEWTAL